MSIAEKLQTIAETEQRVFNTAYVKGCLIGHSQGYDNGYDIGHSEGYTEGYTAGKAEGGDTEAAYNQGFSDGEKSEYDRFWDVRQKNGEPINYEYAFYNWSGELFKPKYDFYFGTNYSANNTFCYCGMTDMQKDCYFTTETAYGVYKTFANCKSLINARTLHVYESLKWNANAFQGCTALEEIRIDGIIGTNGFSVAQSEKLSHDSLMSIINALKDYSGSTATYTVTLGTTNLAKLTDTEKVIATEKGWTLA